MTKEIEEKARERADRCFQNALDDTARRTHDRLKSAQMAAALYACLAARKTLEG